MYSSRKPVVMNCVLLPPYLQTQPYAVRAVLCILCQEQWRGVALTGVQVEAHLERGQLGTSLVKADGRGSGQKAKAFQQRE